MTSPRWGTRTDARRQGRPSPDDRGFTLVELMMAMSVFSILIIGFGLLFASSLKSFTASRVRTTGEQVASGELEKARNLAWADLGTVNGNPPGVLIAGPETVTVGSLNLTVTRRVELIDDPVPSGFTTGANYKRVIIKITAPVMPTPLQFETIVAPPIQPSLYTAVIESQVISNVTDLPLANVTVAVTGGPSADRSDTTDSNGKATFASLTPNPDNVTYYTLTPSLTGWKPAPSTAQDGQVNLAPGDRKAPVLHLYKPGTITLTVKDLGGDPVPTDISLDVSHTDLSGATQHDLRAFKSPTGTITLSDFKGGDIIPGDTYGFVATSIGYSNTASPLSQKLLPVNYPTNVDTAVSLQLPIPARVTTTVRFVDQTTASPMVVSATVTGTPTSSGDDPPPFTTDATGGTTLRLLPRSLPSKYAITVSPTPAGYYPYTGTFVVDGSVKPLTVTIQLQPLPAPTNVVFTVVGGTPALPVPNATVTASGGPSGTLTFTTNALGLATVAIIPGPYTVATAPTGYVAYSQPLTVATSTTTATVTLGAQGAVTFRTKDSVTGLPVGPGGFTVTGAAGPVTVTTDAVGGLASAYLDPGSYTVAGTSSPSGYLPYSGGPLTVVAGAQTVDLPLVQAAVLTVLTKDVATATALGTVTVTLTGPSGTVAVTTDATGTSAAQSLAPGTYTYTTTRSGYAPNKGSITVLGGPSTTTVNITKGVAATFASVKNSGGASLGNATVTLTGGTGADQQITTNGSGTVTVMVVPGTYTVTVVTYPSGYSQLKTPNVTVTIATTYQIKFA